MTRETWNAVDRWFDDALSPADPALEAAAAAADGAAIPAIAVAPNQGKLLQMMARMVGARRVLEVGTLAGYSAIWMGRALPADGRMLTLELEPRHAEVARANLARAGLAGRVEVRVGRAIELLPEIAAEGFGPVDFAFIDADKPSNADYFEWALKLARPGSVIVVDNVVREGAILDPASTDASVLGVKRLRDRVAAEPRVSATVIQTVGSKGWDGLLVARVER